MHFSAFIALVVLATVCSAAAARRPKWHELTATYTYEQYMKDFQKTHSPQEAALRRPYFEAKLAEVLAHNAKEGTTYKRGVNHLTDLTPEELQVMRGGRLHEGFKSKHSEPFAPKGNPVPTALDWRRNFPPVVTAVKDQGACGDCWAHSVTEAIESSYALATGDLLVLSQQQVTACTPMLGECYGCGGSFPTLGFEYAIQNGLAEEWQYPFAVYSGVDVPCNLSGVTAPFVNITALVDVGQNSAESTIEALSTLGPLAVMVDASAWDSYESGIFSGCDYAQNISMDHAVNLVGYGTDNGTDYWLVRNSWAATWGEHGYIRLLKKPVEDCGWNAGAAHVSDCTGYTPSYWACGECGVLFRPQFPLIRY